MECPSQLLDSCLIFGRPAVPLNSYWWEDRPRSKVRRSQQVKGLLLDSEASFLLGF